MKLKLNSFKCKILQVITINTFRVVFKFKNKPYMIAYLNVGKKVGNYETPILFNSIDS